VPDGEALAKAVEVAELIGANGPVAVQAVLASLHQTEGVPEDEALQIEYRIGREVFKTQDAKEGPRAFMEKRKPNFIGR
jgi:enoyl-CoA hydratase